MTLSARISAWSNYAITADKAPAFAVGGTGYSKALPSTQMIKDGQFYTFDYSDSFTLSDAGTHTYKADVDSLGFITADTGVSVQRRSSG